MVRLSATIPQPSDVEGAVGPRLAAALLASCEPAVVIAIAVPDAVLLAIRHASRLQVVQRLTDILIPDGPVVPARLPRDRAA